jgi:predicted transposase YbfD/YdcC
MSSERAASRSLRAHWSIENSLHLVLDVTFDEDRARNGKDNGPKTLGVLRRLAFPLLRNRPFIRSVARKIKLAG